MGFEWPVLYDSTLGMAKWLSGKKFSLNLKFVGSVSLIRNFVHLVENFEETSWIQNSKVTYPKCNFIRLLNRVTDKLSNERF